MSRKYVKTVAKVLTYEQGQQFTFNGIKQGKFLHFIAPQNGILLTRESADELIQKYIDNLMQQRKEKKCQVN